MYFSRLFFFFLVLSNIYAVQMFKKFIWIDLEVCECVSSRQALFLHRQALTEQLKETEDPALVLHLTSVLLFQASTQCMLHAPGRCVPQIIGTLTGKIPTVRATVAYSHKCGKRLHLFISRLLFHSNGIGKLERSHISLVFIETLLTCLQMLQGALSSSG